MGKMIKRKNYVKDKEGSVFTESFIEPLSSFPENNQSQILPIINRSDLRIDRSLSRDQQPIREKILREPKPFDLTYDANKEPTMRKHVLSVPNFRKQLPRKQKIHGIPDGMYDATGHGFVDETNTGLEGQGYG